MNINRPIDVQLQDAFASNSSQRNDENTARIVNKGFLFQENIGTNYAVTYFKHFGIGFDVALRVLSQPSARRKM